MGYGLAEKRDHQQNDDQPHCDRAEAGCHTGKNSCNHDLPSFHFQLVWFIHRVDVGLGWNGCFDRDHAQLLQFPADDQGCLSLGSAVLTLRQIVQRGQFEIPQMDDDFRQVHLV